MGPLDLLSKWILFEGSALILDCRSCACGLKSNESRHFG